MTARTTSTVCRLYVHWTGSANEIAFNGEQSARRRQHHVKKLTVRYPEKDYACLPQALGFPFAESVRESKLFGIVWVPKRLA